MAAADVDVVLMLPLRTLELRCGVRVEERTEPPPWPSFAADDDDGTSSTCRWLLMIERESSNMASIFSL